MCDSTKKQYISCIKIAGIPILPPLITPIKRLEIENYRREAIEIERRLKIKHELASKLPQEIPVHRTLESFLTFNDDALNESTKCENCLPLLEETKKISTLTSDIFDVTEYNDNGIILFNDFKKRNLNNDNLSTSTMELDLSIMSDIPREMTTPPRLLRSNSYTLEFPSPVLLEHFEKQTEYQSAKRPSFDNSPDKTYEASNLSIMSRTNGDVESSQNVIKQDENCDLSPMKSISKVVKSLTQIHFGEIDQEVALNEILAVVPENYAKDIVNLLKRYKSDSCVKSKYKFDDNITDCNLIDIGEQCKNSRDTVKVSDTSSPLLIDLENEDCISLFDCSLNRSINTSEKMDILTEADGNVNSDKLQKQLREQWAAGVLTAAAKGFLVRRLKQSVYVQGLIQTIREALLCAMSLHTEPMDTIQPCDVELHRRLIQQISSACYEFHDVFFTLTTKERMEIIAQDRQKLLMPKSADLSKSDARKSPLNLQKN